MLMIFWYSLLLCDVGSICYCGQTSETETKMGCVFFKNLVPLCEFIIRVLRH